MSDSQILPDMDTHEGGRKFYHYDLDQSDINLDAVWAESHRIERRLADLIHANSDGAFMFAQDGELIYERTWLQKRHQRLRGLLRRRAA